MVTVLMPFYNAEAFLAEAIESILAQTYRDFELLMIDDGSTDNSPAIAQGYAEKDARVRIVRQKNAGVATTLNNGLKLATNEWIARMDADDLMMPRRLERQLAFVKENPDVVVTSSFVHYINGKGRMVGKSKSEFATRAAVAQAFATNQVIGFAHPAVLMRKSVISAAGGYRKEFGTTEDADLWNRIIEKGGQVLVQPEFLLKYRIHEGSVSVAKALATATQVRWLKECMIARRAGRREPTREEFDKAQTQRPFLQRLRNFRKAYAQVHYKTAVVSWANERKIPAIARLIAAGCLDPKFLIGKVRVKSIR